MGAIFWTFLFYSFCGFLLEVAFARVTHSSKQDRKCHLLLPVCPVYGVGALSILFLPAAVTAAPLLLFLTGAVVCTAAEWGLSWFYEKAAGAAFWDYRTLPWNLNGRVCILFSAFWGLLALPLVYGLQPWLLQWVNEIPAAVTIPAVFFYLGDAGTSLFLLRRGGTRALRWNQSRRVIRPS
ncbi:MAG: putative ABC transporter permease [Pseudoflavonifractor sp.]|nr:putative ABC transporter permease [Pseudoflavonifractor sp.]